MKAVLIVSALALALIAAVSLAHESRERDFGHHLMDPEGDGECNFCGGMKVSECLEEMEKREMHGMMEWMYKGGEI
jgi:hypothetical protein